MARRRSIFDDRKPRPPKPDLAPEPTSPLQTEPPVSWDYDTPRPAMPKREAPSVPAPVVSAPVERPVAAPSTFRPLAIAAVGGAMLALAAAVILIASFWLRPEVAVGTLGY